MTGTGGSEAAMSVVLPSSWKVIDLDPSTRERSIDRLVRQAIGTADQLALYRRWAIAAYRRMVADAADAGAFFAATYAEEVAGHPLAASLLMFLGTLPEGPGGGQITLDQMMIDLGDPALGEETVDPPREVELSTGKAVRSRCRVEAEVPDSGGEATVDVTRFFVPIPEDDRLLVMAFSTPILPVSDALADLFDRVAQAVRWRL
jgi:hypothetical protein